MSRGKFFPPIIDTKLPAFIGNSFIVPFEMNRSVSFSDIIGMSAIIKTATTNKTLATITTGRPEPNNNSSYGIRYSSQEGKYIASFDCPSNLDLKIGQYYKVQIAYISQDLSTGTAKEIIGYYSAAGIIKKTAEPQLEIVGSDETLFSRYNYTGHYVQEDDPTEKVYKYRFDLYDIQDNLIDSSGDCLHNSNTDIQSNESSDTWKANVELPLETPYILKYSIITNNGLQKTCSARVVATESVDIDLDISIESKLNYEDGIVELYLRPQKNDESLITGSFVLVRSSSLTNFSVWDEVHRFSYLNFKIYKTAPLLLWEDYSVQQGERYIYAIQAYNSYNLYSNHLKAVNNEILVDFEHCYISDASRQLKIQFNPKVSSFKNNVLESKVDTLGSQYPFIFKNGYVHYKEFPISGLLSILSDSNNKFISINSTSRNKRISTPGFEGLSQSKINLSSENIYNERQFKMEVLEWLNNGEPKIFRSPTEGNFIVRIMNVSLSPNDTLGRMLHNLNCTAYEIADWNFSNLIKYNLVLFPEGKASTLRIGQIIPSEMYSTQDVAAKYPLFTIQDDYTINFPPSYSVNITEATPGTRFQLKFLSGDAPIIEIGGTGAYYVQIAKQPNLKENNYFNGLSLISGNWGGAKITFEYYDDVPYDTFSQISNITLNDEIRRFVGPGYDINLVDPDPQGANLTNIISDIRREVGTFYFIKVEKRYIQEMWYVSDNIYARNHAQTDIIQDNEWNPNVIYHDNIYNIYYDGQLDRPLQGAPDFRFCLNDVETNYSDFGGRSVENNDTVAYGNTFGRIDAIRNVKDVKVLRAGTGLLLDVSYRVRTKKYGVEDLQSPSLKNAKNAWIQSRQDLSSLLQGKLDGVNPTPNNIKAYSSVIDAKYKLYIQELTEALNQRNT